MGTTIEEVESFLSEYDLKYRVEGERGEIVMWFSGGDRRNRLQQLRA